LARAAATLLDPGQVVILDGGSTAPLPRGGEAIELVAGRTRLHLRLAGVSPRLARPVLAGWHPEPA
jgi:hypothetical protein